MRKQWATSPNIRGLAQDYPIDETDAEMSPLMFNGVGGSMLIFAGAWPRMLPSDFRVRSLDGIADDWPLTYDELLPVLRAHRPRSSASRGMGGDPAYPPGGEDPPLPPLPMGAAGSRSPGPTPGSAGTGGRSSTRSSRPRTTAAGRASSAAPASRAATRARRRRPT